MPAMLKWPLIAIGLAAAVASGVVAMGATTNDLSGQAVALDGVSAGDLARNGLVLAAPPSDYAPSITATDATAAVAKYSPGARVKQVVLARVLNEMAVPKTDRVLWVANLDVEGRVMGLHHGGLGGMPNVTPYLYSLVLVDPATGAALGEVSLGAPLWSPSR